MRSIRWKIMLLCVAGILAPVLLLNYYTIHTFDRFTSRDLEEHMIDSAFIVAEQYKSMMDDTNGITTAQETQLARMARNYGREVQSRIQILSPSGTVLIDSATNGITGADLSYQPEVKTALTGRYRARCALTDDRKYMYYYIAYPVTRGDRVSGVIYVSRHTSNIINKLKEMIRTQRVTTTVACAVALFLSGLLAWSITGRLRRLTTATTAFAAGDPAVDVEVRGRDEVATLAKAIGRMMEEIKRTNRYNREFISTVMHELKMPITAIKGAAELLEQGAVNKEDARSRFLGNIRFEADRFARLVWELNELTKLDTEIPHAHKETMDYGTCVKEIVDRFNLTLDSEHAPIVLTLPEKVIRAKIMPGRIEQVIGNLLDNAVRYTPVQGKIEVKVEPGPDNTVVTSVSDTGSGIAPSNVQKVFDRFFTTEPKDKPKDYGSGLGLAIAKSIVENHGGRIWVETAVGRGSTFFFTLPRVEH